MEVMVWPLRIKLTGYAWMLPIKEHLLRADTIGQLVTLKCETVTPK
jgi:flavin-dependent dehydrogenase